MLNPYRKKAANSSNSRSSGSDELGGSNDNEINSVVTNPNPSSMGQQSQRGVGSVKGCLARASKKAKYKYPKSRGGGGHFRHGGGGLVQMGVDGGLAFEANRDCVNCRSRHLRNMGYSVALSHKTHDVRCVKNRSTRGLSVFTVMVDKYSKKMATINTMPLSQGHTEGLPSVANHFGTSPTTTTTTTTRTSSTGTTATTTVTGSATSTGSNKANKCNRQGNAFC
jgi:hypothetical protein